MKYSMICCVLYGLLLVVLASKEGFIKGRVYVSPLPNDLPELRHRIEEAIASMTSDLLTEVWEELDFRLDLCRIIKGAPIEHLYEILDGIDFCSWYAETLEANKNGFRCLNGKKSIPRELYCNGEDNCGDNSDEEYCRIPADCPEGFMICNYYYYPRRCIPSTWRCNGFKDCENGNDEKECSDYNRPATPYTNWAAAEKVTKWVTEQRSEFGNAAEKWGSGVDRLALTLYYATDKFDISKSNETEMTNELTIRLLSRLLSEKISDIPSTELASYVNAFLALCMNPRNFYGYDIVQEMRNQVDQEIYTNPYVFLALCNAGESITEADREKLTDTFENKQRTFWTGTQALVVMALACANKQQPGNEVDIVEFLDMMPKLKKQFHANVTGIDLRTKALILQAMISTYPEGGSNSSDQIKTFQELLRNQKSDGSFGDVMDTFLVTPLLSCKSLADINSDHCKKSAEIPSLNDLYPENGPTTRVQYSLWIGDEKNMERNLVLRVPQNTSVYGVMERAAEVDSRFKFNYAVKNAKPFINAISERKDNPLTGKFWFLYKVQNGESTLSKESPADIIPSDNDHYVMWYRRGIWVDRSL